VLGRKRYDQKLGRFRFRFGSAAVGNARRRRQPVEPYVNLLSAPVRFLTTEEAKASGYDDPGNPELANAER
jgi:hypothetical protein